MTILGIHIINSSREEILEKVEGFLFSDKQNIIVTPNPEIILQAQDDEELFHILNIADLSLADGIGLKLLGLLLGESITRITGADLLIDILKMAQRQKLKIGVINWAGGLSSAMEIEIAIKKKFPEIKVFVIDINRGDNIDKNNNYALLQNCEIILTTLGAPYQEKIIFNNLVNFPKARILIGIGGALDFLTGKIKRAPLFFRKIGLEWFWRLIKQPVRLKRIVNAVIVFPLKFFKFHFINCFFYRPNVAWLLYKKTKTGNYFLLINRSNANPDWQIPQGGLDGLSVAVAAKKEIGEELGINQFKEMAVFKNVHRYKYVDKKVVIKHRGYKGQKQSLYIAEFVGSDDNVKIKAWEHEAWKWVSEDGFISALHPVRQEGGKLFLEKFQKIDKKK